MAIAVVSLTQAQYDALGFKDPNTLYVVTDGADRTLLTGARAAAGGDGINGDFWINTAAWTISGPKAAGAWPTAVSIVGPQGTPGTNGTNGTNGTSPPLAINFVIGDGNAVITAGLKGWVEVPADWTGIESGRLVADVSGSIVVEVWRSAYATAPPVVAGKISGTAPLTLAGAVRAQDTTLTGWTKTGTKGDYLAFNVVSAATVKIVDVSLVLVR